MRVKLLNKELIKLDKFPRIGDIGVKKMGKLDYKPFHNAMKRKYNEDEAYNKASDLYLLWEEYIRDPKWYPFKAMPVDHGNVMVVENVVNVEDEKLKGLKENHGEDVCNVIITALTEINEHNPSGKCIIPELWNYKKCKKAQLKEGVEVLLKVLEDRKSL